MDDSRIGTVLDQRYRILERLGTGGMGVVYRGERLKLGRPVAIKFLHEWMASDSSFLKRFELEARAMAKLQHPNCASVIDFGVDGTAPYVVMDLVAGESLRDLIDREPIPIERAVEIIRGVLAGLAHAHEQGITHRDIKPDNIMVDTDPEFGDQVRILDFGLAKMREGATELTAGFVIGTPSYMAPEQTRAERVDARTDVYSTGIVLFEMLTGAKPFEADTAIDVMDLHRGTPPPRLVERLPEAAFSSALEAVVSRAMAKAPGDRFTTAAEFARALDETPEAARPRAPTIPPADRDDPTQRDPMPSARLRAPSTPAELGVAPTAMLDPSGIDLVAPVDTDAMPPMTDDDAIAGPSTTGAMAEPSAADTTEMPPAMDTSAMQPAADTGAMTASLAGDGGARPSGPHAAAGRESPTVAGARRAPTPDPSRDMMPTDSRPTTPLGVVRPNEHTPYPPMPTAPPGKSRRGIAIAGGVGTIALLVIVAAVSSGGSAPSGSVAGAALDATSANADPDDPEDPDIAEDPDDAEDPEDADDPDDPEHPQDVDIEIADPPVSPDAPDTPPELVKLKNKLRNGQKRGAEKKLIQLGRKYPKNAEIPFILGQLYFAKLWVSDGIDAFRKAIRIDNSYRSNSELIQSALNGYGNDRGHWRVHRFILNDIGKSAIPYLEAAQKGAWRDEAKQRAARTLKALR